MPGQRVLSSNGKIRTSCFRAYGTKERQLQTLNSPMPQHDILVLFSIIPAPSAGGRATPYLLPGQPGQGEFRVQGSGLRACLGSGFSAEFCLALSAFGNPAETESSCSNIPHSPRFAGLRGDGCGSCLRKKRGWHLCCEGLRCLAVMLSDL